MHTVPNVPTTLEERTVRFSTKDLERLEKVPCLNLDDLKETAAYKLKGSDDYMLIECEPTTVKTHCPVCHMNALTKNGHSSYPRLVHDVNVGLMQVDLSISVPRYECQRCGASITHEFDDVVPGKQFTKRLYQQIKVDSFNRKFTDVAQDFGISDTKVADIFDEYTAELEKKRGVVMAPKKHLALDEKHVEHKMRGVLVNGDNGEILEMTEKNDYDSISKAITSLQGWQNITHITTDMANGYRTVIEDLYGSSVTLVVDKFHVLHDLSSKIIKCRTLIIDYLNNKINDITDKSEKEHLSSVKKLVTDNNYLFKYGTDKLTEKSVCTGSKCHSYSTCKSMIQEDGKFFCPNKPSRLETLAIVCKTFPEFNHLRLLKEGFELIYDCQDRESALGVFQEWLALVPPSGKRQEAKWEEEYGVPAMLFEPIKSFAKLVNTTWNIEIFNYFNEDSFVTNAIAESTNAFIERAVINGYSFKRLRAKALYSRCAGGRTRYVINIRQKAVQNTTRTKSLITSNNWNISAIQYENVYGIFEEPKTDNLNDIFWLDNIE